MSIIKAEDFEKINQNKLTIEELRQQERAAKNYTDAQIDIRKKMAEAEQAVTQSLTEEITLLTNRLQLAQKSCRMAEQEVERIRAAMAANREVAELKQQLADEKQYVAELTAQFAALEKKQSVTEQALDKAGQDYAALQTQYAALQEQQQRQEQTAAAAERQLAGLKDQLAIAKQDAELRAAALEREHAEHAKILADIVTLNEAAVANAAKMTQLQKELLRSETEIAAVREDLRKKTLHNEQLQTDKAQLQQSLDKQQRNATELSTQLKQTKDTRATGDKDVRALQTKVAALEQAKEKAIGELNRVIGALRAEQDKTIKFESDFQRAAVEFKTLKEELTRAKDTIVILKSQLRIAERETMQDGVQVIEVPVQA